MVTCSFRLAVALVTACALLYSSSHARAANERRSDKKILQQHQRRLQNSDAAAPSRPRRPGYYIAKYAPSQVSDGRFIGGHDMGVQYCRLFVDGRAFGEQLDYTETFVLHVFLRYTWFNNASKVKGTASAELLEDLNDKKHMQDVQIDPQVIIRTRDNATTYQMSGTVTFPFVPVIIAAATSPLFVKFTLPPGSDHEYYISSLGANSSCSFRPALSPNVLDPRGVEVPIEKDTSTEATEAYIIMSPFYVPQDQPYMEYMDKLALLLGRHIQWHHALGFSKHLVYMRAADIMIFSKMSTVHHWLQSGQLLLVLWEPIPERPSQPYYDQRIVYTHSILAFTGLNVYLAMMDLDEYLMSMRQDIETFRDMNRACNTSDVTPLRHLVAGRSSDGSGSGSGMLSAGATRYATSLQITRYNALASRYYRQAPEVDLWMESGFSVEHPLQRYSLINRMRPPAVKSIVRPEFIRTYNIHFGASYNAFSSAAPDPDCMFILHLKNLFTGRERADTKATLRRLGFMDDPRLEQSLRTRAARLDYGWEVHWPPAPPGPNTQ